MYSTIHHSMSCYYRTFLDQVKDFHFLPFFLQQSWAELLVAVIENRESHLEMVTL